MNNQATLLFVASLHDFIEAGKRDQPCLCRFDDSPSVKDLIESRGVPHTEVAAIVVNTHAVDFNYQVIDGDEITVYPFDALPQPGPELLLIKPQDHEPAFILDVHLGTLARYLRLAGFDVVYQKKDPGDEWIAITAANEGRIVVSRDKGLLKRAIITQGCWLRNTNPKRQMKELVQRYQLTQWFHPFKRCTHCNGLVHVVAKHAIEARLPEHVRQHMTEFRECSQCHHVYWKGSHYKKINKFIHDLAQT